VRGLYATANEVLNDVAQIDRLAVAIWEYRHSTLFIGLEEAGAPSINTV
jgi:hypothetical protein